MQNNSECQLLIPLLIEKLEKWLVLSWNFHSSLWKSLLKNQKTGMEISWQNEPFFQFSNYQQYVRCRSTGFLAYWNFTNWIRLPFIVPIFLKKIGYKFWIFLIIFVDLVFRNWIFNRFFEEDKRTLPISLDLVFILFYMPLIPQ